MRRFRLSRQAWLLVILAIAVIGTVLLALQSRVDQRHALALLVADGTNPELTLIWQQAALEEGIKLDVVTASQFLRASQSEQRSYAGIVAPDTIHHSASTYLTDALREYVSHGGRLMLVFDALTWDLNGAYLPKGARLADTAGVNYAMYARFGKDVMRAGPVIGSTDSMRRIGIPPGRSEQQPPVQFGTRQFDRWMTTYRYQDLKYPQFQTGDVANGTEVLLITPERQVVAAQRHFGQGRTLFVNLPLGQLKNSTDGLLLHAFLRFFSDEFVGLPRLLAAPDGIGGLILNIHVDNGAAIKSLDTLEKMGVFAQGPYSIHFTAGPDVNRFGDGFGMDVDHNPATRQWIRKLQAGGHAIGNHGGWIHNYFGTHINETNRAANEQFLALNNDAMRAATGTPITEYSAPIGNHPLWVTEWIARHGMITYYTTSNLGMGPTRMFRNNTRIDGDTWSIPVTPFGRIASFEEAMFANQPAASMTQWLIDLSHFVATNQTIRQIYCHPIGVPYYAESMRALLDTTRALQAQHQFVWRTMTEVARFMSRREAVQWQVDGKPGQIGIRANDATTLDHMSWIIPANQCGSPTITQGNGAIQRVQSGWQVSAGNVRQFEVRCAERQLTAARQ